MVADTAAGVQYLANFDIRTLTSYQLRNRCWHGFVDNTYSDTARDATPTMIYS